MNDVSSVPQQQVLRHQQAGFSDFFASRARYPIFKSKRHKQLVRLSQTQVWC